MMYHCEHAKKTARCIQMARNAAAPHIHSGACSGSIVMKDFNKLVWRRIRQDRLFALAVLIGAIRNLCAGDFVTSRLMIRDFVKGLVKSGEDC